MESIAPSAPETTTTATSAPSSLPVVEDAAPSPWPITHTIVEADHLHRVELRVGDFLETPADEAFVWTPQPSQLLQALKPDGGPRSKFKAVRAGSAQFVVRGDPKCRALDASCGTSVREWTVFVVVR